MNGVVAREKNICQREGAPERAEKRRQRSRKIDRSAHTRSIFNYQVAKREIAAEIRDDYWVSRDNEPRSEESGRREIASFAAGGKARTRKKTLSGESSVLRKKSTLGRPECEGEEVDASREKKEVRKEARSEIWKLGVCLPSHCCSNRINSEVKFVHRNG